MFIYVLRITVKQFLNLKYLNPEDSVQLTEPIVYQSLFSAGCYKSGYIESLNFNWHNVRISVKIILV